MANPFKKIIKNTKDSEQTYKIGAKTSSKVNTRVCPKCKAPRPADTNLTTCDYCGFRFMDIDVEIKSDT